MDKQTLERIKAVSIEDIVEDLGITVRNHKCRCPFHEDHHPSMKLYAQSNSACCFVCGKTWDGIAMVEQLKGLDFTDACHWIADHNNIWIDVPHKLYPTNHTLGTCDAFTKHKRLKEPSNMTPNPSSLNPDYVTAKLSIDNTFCRSLVSNGILTEEQMRHAAERYRLGSAKDGGVIFWQIDEKQRVRDGKIMYYNDDCHRSHNRNPNWVCNLLSKAGRLPIDHRSQKCLFGLHLLSQRLVLSDERLASPSINDKPSTINDEVIIAIVESEKTAVICSELIPTLSAISSQLLPVIWLATGGISCLNTEILRPLVDHKVMIFPDTDTDATAFRQWTSRAQEASKVLNHPFPVSNLLELHATPDQKSRKIDLADFIIESK